MNNYEKIVETIKMIILNYKNIKIKNINYIYDLKISITLIDNYENSDTWNFSFDKDTDVDSRNFYDLNKIYYKQNLFNNILEFCEKNNKD